MTIAAPDVPCQWGEASEMATYLKNRLPQNTSQLQHYPLTVFMATD
jgi:hypothetical protein